MIYRCLLVAPEIDNPSHLVNEKMRSLIIPASHPRLIILSVDATALRTCRRIYEEALPVLYGENTYVFSTAISLETFKGEGLIRTACKPLLYRSHCIQEATNPDGSYPIAIVEDYCTFLYSFNFQSTPHGRFQLLRRLHLEFSLEEETAIHDSQKCQLLCEWTPFFTENKYTDKALYIKFPALEDLTLDFSGWELQDGEGIMVSQVISVPLPCNSQSNWKRSLTGAFSPRLPLGP